MILAPAMFCVVGVGLGRIAFAAVGAVWACDASWLPAVVDRARRELEVVMPTLNRAN